MEPISIRNKQFSTRLTQRATPCKPVARPRSGLRTDRLQRGFSNPLANLDCLGWLGGAPRSARSCCLRDAARPRKGKRAKAVLISANCFIAARAEAIGYYPQVVLSGRRINDGMGAFIAQRLVKLDCG